MAKASKRASIVRRATHTVLESLEGRRLLSASPGSLDSGFGSGGIVTTAFNGPTQDSVEASIHLDNGQSMVAGTSDGNQVLARYNADGSRDTSFGNGGYVTVDGSSLQEINSLAEENGQILAGGEVNGVAAIARFNADGSVDTNFGSNGVATLSGVGDNVVGVAFSPNSDVIDAAVNDSGDFAVAQLAPDGSLDSSFAGTGYTTIDLGSDQDIPAAIAVSNTDIYVVGSMIQNQYQEVGEQVTSEPFASFAMVDLNLDGSFNTSFGSGGIFVQNLSEGGYHSAIPSSMQIMSNGDLLVGGTVTNQSGENSLQMVGEVMPNGEFDGRFAKFGEGYEFVSYGQSPDNIGYGVTTDSAGNIYLAGQVDVNDSQLDASVTKLTPLGAPDDSFGAGNGGIAVQDFGANSVYRSIWINANNEIQVVGTEAANGDSNFVQAVYNTTDGSNDSTFGSNGTAIDGFTSDSATATGRAVVQQSDGKLIAVGTVNDGGSDVIALARYNTDGSLDSSFGLAGETAGSFAVQDVDGAALTPDGHILVAFTRNNGSETDLAVACFNSDGSLDTNFGNNGVAVNVNPASNDTAVAIGISPDGSEVYVAGQSADLSSGAVEFEIAGFSTSDGSEDNSNIISFNNNDPNNGPAIDALTGMSVQSDGNIVLAGYSYDAQGNFDVALARVTSSLSLDGSFGTGGEALDNNGLVNQTMAIATDSSNNIYVAEANVDPNSGDTSEGVLKFDDTGSLVSGFGDNGFAAFTIGNGLTTVAGISVGSDGSITLGGTVQDQDTGMNSDGAARFTSDGQLDPNFGNGGTTDVAVDANNGSDAPGFAVQADGNIVLLGSSDGDFAAVRLVGATAQQAPPPVADAGPDQTVNEGTTVNFDGSASTGDDLTYSWDLNGDGTFGDATGPTASYTYTDNGTFTVSLQVTDAEGRTSVDSLTVTVNNVPPTASVSGPSSLVPGQTGTFNFGATDPSSVDQASNFTYDINWGDGTPDMIVTGSASISENHVFTTNANDTVTVTATDKDGGTSTPATTGVAITAPDAVTATEQDDPLNPGQTMLVVQGTAGNDVIELDYSQAKVNKVLVQTVTVQSNGVAIFSTTDSLSRIQVFANSGDDSVTHGGGFKRAVELYGGDGNDSLRAGSQGDILVGGAGNDSLYSGAGNDVEIGGTGADKIVGDAGQDLLISGYTSYDNDPASLVAISAEWTSTDDFNTRVAALQAGVGPGGSIKLIADDSGDNTVFDDGVKDTLNGGGNDSDWLIYNYSGGGVYDKAAGNTTGDVLEDM